MSKKIRYMAWWLAVRRKRNAQLALKYRKLWHHRERQFHRLLEMSGEEQLLLDALAEILDLTTGWTRPMTDGERLVAIHKVSARAFHHTEDEETADVDGSEQDVG